ncbi:MULTISPECIES: hypothetical protein [Streptomyces]|uniref:hypothetical protein n=1 Tax=Streptomyces TaxID=1883 RepID=UPI00210B8832|nr:hypothetical protein [Streptomyces longispororuber]MCQ4212893.1 hypothetical protein [Streptomyces longispororuber]
MTSTRRALTAVLLAVGATAIAVPTAGAAPIPLAGEGSEAISPTATLDSVSTMAIPADQRGELPTTAGQLSGLDRLNELHQLTDLVAPVTNVVPSVQ